MKSRSQAATGSALMPAALLLLSGALAPAQPAPGGAATSRSASTVTLEYREISEVLVSRSVEVKRETSLFQREPKLPGKEVFRGLLQWGHTSEPPIAFIWDRSQGQLYLDLNRNRDLTDDAKGVFASGTNGPYQGFTNVSLPRATAAGLHPTRVRLDFRSYQPSAVNVSAGLCSYWEARVSLRGREWQFGLVEDASEPRKAVAPAYLLLRPWADRERAFNLSTSSPDFTEYSTNLFFGGQTYALDCRFESQGTPPGYRVAFIERPVRLGELKVNGAFLHRLILKEDRGLVAVLDQPEGTLKVPAGSYAVDEIWLRKGDAEAARFKAGRITVDGQQPATLTTGGPLTNSVKVVSQGFDLSLRYELLGADGGAYHFPRPDREHPPEFAIFQGTNRLAADKFRYG